jgi:hypothetical protein
LFALLTSCDAQTLVQKRRFLPQIFSADGLLDGLSSQSLIAIGGTVGAVRDNQVDELG